MRKMESRVVTQLATVIILLLCRSTTSSSLTDSAVKIISKSEWNGKQAAGEFIKMQLPLRKVIIVHTATTTCSDQESCIEIVRSIQNFHMSSHFFDDIAYNFLIGNDGNVYEGRSWENQGAYARGYNSGSLGLAYIGTFIDNLPTEAALKAGKALLDLGIRTRKIADDFELFAHCQLTATKSPGKALYNFIKQSPHWSTI